MPSPQTVCFACRLRLFSSLRTAKSLTLNRFQPSIQWRALTSTPRPKRHSSQPSQTQASTQDPHVDLSTPRSLPANDNYENLEGDTTVEDGIEVGEQKAEPLDAHEALRAETEEHDPEVVARAARQAFGDRLPEGALTLSQYKVYRRLYGTPIIVPDRREPAVLEEEAEEEGEEEEGDADVLLREGKDGLLEEVELVEDEQLSTEASPMSPGKRSYADDQLAKDIISSLQEGDSERTLSTPEEQNVDDEELAPEFVSDAMDAIDSDETVRTHPFTRASRFGTSPSTLPLPRGGMTEPTALLLSNLSNKHLDGTADRLFGGPGLPYSPATPLSSRKLPQKPIPINPGQTRMSDMEAEVYLAAVMPGAYAAVTSALTEIRRRLGASWLETLLKRKGGPKILDAGAGGAGVLAWREVLKAEWHRMHADSLSGTSSLDASDTSAISDRKPETRIPPTPVGKATVLTGSSALRQRASVLLENTTFLPRLPDYVHAQFPSEDSQRKQFDVIVAPYTLWHLPEDHERKAYVLNLWNLLDPNGGVLVLLEKGVPRGFEVIAEARGYLLKDLFEREDGVGETDDPGADKENPSYPKGDDRSSLERPGTGEHSQEATSSKTSRLARRAPGRILAPCPHHSKCPMYLVPGVSRQRKDYCRFSQRYIRPPYLQRMLGAKDRNYDDVEFSYIAVQKGVSADADTTSLTGSASPPPPKEHHTHQRLTGETATDRAFAGYDLHDDDLPTTPTPSSAPPIPNPLPRLLLPPLKRHGHVHLDMCLPSGAFERWTVPRSYGQQAYRDARKAQWGDLWALGAKHREARRVRLGVGHLERGIGTGRGADARLLEKVGRDPGAGRVDGVAGAGRYPPKDKGRLKARRRKREERREVFAAAVDGEE